MDETTLQQLTQRLDDIELMLMHLHGHGYAPTHRGTVEAIERVRLRCAPALAIASSSAGQPTVTREPSLADRVFEAAASARAARARIDTLREQGADEDTLLEAQVAAEEAETRAQELSEQARERYGAEPQA